MRDGPTLLSIFAGIGGFDLAFHSAGFRTLAFVEWEPIKQCVLREHFPGVHIFGDIDEFDCGEFLRTFGRPDVIAGGVPCQAISLLGKRLGVADPRWKWPQTIRLVRELRPRYCVFENPPAILSADSGRAFNGIVSQMAALGYDGWWDVIPAAAFGAGHWRERLCIVFADANNLNWRTRGQPRGQDRREVNHVGCESGGTFPANAHSERRSEAGECLPEEKSADDLRRQSAENGGEELSADAMRSGRAEGRAGRLTGDCERASEQTHEMDAADSHSARPQRYAGDGAGSVRRSDSRRSVAAPHLLPDLRGRVTGPDWWHEANSGVRVLAHGIPNKLVEAISLCAGDAVVPQAWEPIAQVIAEQLRK